MYRSLVIDLICDGWRELTERVVGQFGYVHDGVDALEFLNGEVANVLRQLQWRGIEPVVQPTMLVVPGVDTQHLMAVSNQLWRQQAAEIAIGTSDKYFH